MKVHFVCSGNTFRSRLAEAYLKSKKIDGVTVSSSGIKANCNPVGYVCSYTVEVLDSVGLLPFIAPDWQLTSKELIKGQDLVLFMSAEQELFCAETLQITPAHSETWDIPDMKAETIRSADQTQIFDEAKSIFELITNNVDRLVAKLNNGNQQ